MHYWAENLLAVQERKREDGTKEYIPVYWFPKCISCGCLVTMQGGKFLYRPTSTSEWMWQEPECHVQVP